MGDRLARFGFLVGGRETLSPTNAKSFLKEQIAVAYARNAALSKTPRLIKSGTGLSQRTVAHNPDGTPYTVTGAGGIFGGGGTPLKETVYARQTAALGQELIARGLPTVAGGGPSLSWGSSGTDINPAFVTNQGPELFNQEFFGRVFGTGNRLGKGDDVTKLFKSEKAAYQAVDFIFENNPAAGDLVFRAAQEISNQLQEVRDDRMSGGPLGGPLRVASFGLGVSGLSAKLFGPTTGQAAGAPTATGQLKAAGAALGEVVAGQAARKLVEKLLPAQSSQSGVIPGVQTGAQRIAQATRSPTGSARSTRRSFAPVILSALSRKRIDSQRNALGKSNLTNGGSKRLRRVI